MANFCSHQKVTNSKDANRKMIDKKKKKGFTSNRSVSTCEVQSASDLTTSELLLSTLLDTECVLSACNIQLNKL